MSVIESQRHLNQPEFDRGFEDKRKRTVGRSRINPTVFLDSEKRTDKRRPARHRKAIRISSRGFACRILMRFGGIGPQAERAGEMAATRRRKSNDFQYWLAARCRVLRRRPFGPFHDCNRVGLRCVATRRSPPKNPKDDKRLLAYDFCCGFFGNTGWHGQARSLAHELFPEHEPRNVTVCYSARRLRRQARRIFSGWRLIRKARTPSPR